MVEPEAGILEALDGIHAELRRIEAKVDAASDAALARRLDGIENTLRGLTLAVVAGFGALVRERGTDPVPSRRADRT